MGKMEGVPYDQGAHIGTGNYGPVVAGICHRTQGNWGGDYHIGKFSSGPPDFSGFHFLIGKDFGQWVQFYDTSTKCNHARGANEWAIGLEFSGNTGQPLNYWQLIAGAKIIQWSSSLHRIPQEWYSGSRIGKGRGWRGHVSVLGSDHTDTITPAEFKAMVSGNPMEVLAMGYNLVHAVWVPEKNCAVGVDATGHVYLDTAHQNLYNGAYADMLMAHPPRTDFKGISADGKGYTLLADDLSHYSFTWKV